MEIVVVAGIVTSGPSTEAGVLSPFSTLASTATPTPNNEDYTGTFANNVNKATFNSNAVPVASGTISRLEGVFAVADSNGATEYALTIQGAYDSAVDPPLSSGYRLQLGFGVGANFVPASVVFPALDFDFPQPSNPALPTAISLFGITPLFDLQSHRSDAIVWSGHDLNGSFFHTSLFRLPIDVPDLPATVMTHYAAGELPLDFPQGAKAFTIRGSFIPEPTTSVLAAITLFPLLRLRQNCLRMQLKS